MGTGASGPCVKGQVTMMQRARQIEQDKVDGRLLRKMWEGI